MSAPDRSDWLLFRRLPAVNRQAGATLLEALAYLTVAAMVTTGVITMFRPGFSNAQATRLMNEVTTLENNVRDLYASQNTYSSISVGSLIQGSAVPSTLKTSGSGGGATLSDTWGGAVTVAAVGNGAAVQYANVPSDVCQRALALGGDWSDIKVNGSDLATGAPTLAQVNNACNSASGNTIEWIFQ